MKKVIILLLAMCSMATFAWAAQEPVGLTAGKIKQGGGGNDSRRSVKV